MRKNASSIVLGSLLVLATMLLVSCSKPTTASDKNNPAAVRFVQDMAAGNYASATSQFDSTMSQAMPAAQLKAVWEGVIGQCGRFKKLGNPRAAREMGVDEVFVPMEFEKVTLDAKVVFDAQGKISGLWFVEHKDVPAVEPSSSTPSYDDRNAYTDSDVKVGTGKLRLPGTLSMPKGGGPFPAIVLVHGSGPNDRDETVGANRPFRDLAAGLASQGIAVLRYDKRTKVYPKEMAAVKKLTVKDEVIDDAVAAAEFLRKTEKIDASRVFVLGHSLGGMLIPRIGKADPRIAGLIVMAGPTRPLEDIIVEQIEYLTSSAPSDAAKKRIDEVKAQVAKVKNPKLTDASPNILGAPGSYWLDLRGYNPAEAAKLLKQPMLILQGGRDYQVTKGNYEIWQKALSDQPRVTFKLYPDLNHLFGEGKGKSVPAEYEQRTPVPQYVIDDIAGWVKAH